MNRHLKYKGVTVGAFGLPVLFSKENKVTESKNPKKIYSLHKHFDFNFAITAPKNQIVMYDIPFNKRSERDWFRSQLRRFNYIMIQKSVWVGPSPLPHDFLNYVKSIGLKNKLIILKLAKPYLRGGHIM